MIKTTIAPIFFAALLVVSCKAQGDDVCVLSSKGVCRIPFDAVFFARERLLDRNVGVQGIASVEEDGVYFYPDTESKKFHVREKAVLVIGSDSYLRDIKYMDGKRLNFVGYLGLGEGNFWATITLTNEPLEEPFPIKDYPPAPPPPPSLNGRTSQ